MQYSRVLVALLIVVLSICSINAQDGTVAYAGSTDGQATFYPPDTNGQTCAPDSTAYAFVAFNITFPVTGLREVAVLSNYEVYVYIYANSFNPVNPCVNVLGDGYLTDGFDSDLEVDDVFWFNASTVYYVVIAGDVNTDPQDVSNYFAINIFAPNYNGNTFQSTSFWAGVEDTQDGSTPCTAEDSESDLPYGNFTWTQTYSGWFDISVMFYNATGTDYFYAALYNATNFNITADPCPSSFIAAMTSDYYGGVIWYVWLNESVTYSVIVSSDYTDETGYFAVALRPTWVRFPNLDGWNQPVRDTTVACSADTDNTDSGWDAIVFQPNGYVTLFDTTDAPSRFGYFDSESFWYSGDNSHGAVVGTVPSTCPLTQSFLTYGDTGSYVISWETQANNTYTIIVSSYYGDTLDAGDAYVYYLFTGFPLGVQPSTVSTGATATTGSNPTSANPTTGTTGVTSATVTGTTGTVRPTVAPTTRPSNVSTPTPNPTRPANVTTTTTSGVSAVAASTLLMAAVVAAMF